MLPPYRPFKDKPVKRDASKLKLGVPPAAKPTAAIGGELGKLMPRMSAGAARAGTGGLAPERVQLKSGRRIG
ncbi:MAG: hypothetical protein AAFR55_05845 [Pseudomonadota bacterium]